MTEQELGPGVPADPECESDYDISNYIRYKKISVRALDNQLDFDDIENPQVTRVLKPVITASLDE